MPYDAIIIGSGPAGSTCATILAQNGSRVLIIEKESFPRFHIGESLLPSGNQIFRDIGIWNKIENAGFIKKWGGEFTYGDGSNMVYNKFSNGLIKGLDYSYQVERSKFDQILLDHACESGCELHQAAQVIDIKKQGEGWEIVIKEEGKEAEMIQAKFIFDASGQRCLLARHLKLAKHEIPIAPRIAVFNHFTGVGRHDGERAGNIIITRIAEGWFWSIPLDDKRSSVGLVSMRSKGLPKDLATFFYKTVAENPFMKRCMQSSKAILDFKSAANFSYEYDSFCGSNYFLLGDAAGFLDPVFSSGVYLAMESASQAAYVFLKHGAGKEHLSQRQQRKYTQSIKRRMRVMLRLIRIFYDNSQFSVYMHPTNKYRLFEAVNSIVSGITKLNFSLAWRFYLFCTICRLNKYFNFAPKIGL